MSDRPVLLWSILSHTREEAKKYDLNCLGLYENQKTAFSLKNFWQWWMVMKCSYQANWISLQILNRMLGAVQKWRHWGEEGGGSNRSVTNRDKDGTGVLASSDNLIELFEVIDSLWPFPQRVSIFFSSHLLVNSLSPFAPVTWEGGGSKIIFAVTSFLNGPLVKLKSWCLKLM